jgi:hypothetical protein
LRQCAAARDPSHGGPEATQSASVEEREPTKHPYPNRAGVVDAPKEWP